MTDETDAAPSEAPSERPWIDLKTTHDVEAWIDNHNRDLQRFMKTNNASGCGICFCLAQGGDLYLHTTSEGEVLLDVTPEAEWVAPLIAAATRVENPNSQIWALPGETLTQLVLGLSSLISSSRPVLSHHFKALKTGANRVHANPAGFKK